MQSASLHKKGEYYTHTLEFEFYEHLPFKLEFLNNITTDRKKLRCPTRMIFYFQKKPQGDISVMSTILKEISYHPLHRIPCNRNPRGPNCPFQL